MVGRWRVRGCGWERTIGMWSGTHAHTNSEERNQCNPSNQREQSRLHTNCAISSTPMRAEKHLGFPMAVTQLNTARTQPRTRTLEHTWRGSGSEAELPSQELDIGPCGVAVGGDGRVQQLIAARVSSASARRGGRGGGGERGGHAATARRTAPTQEASSRAARCGP